MKSTFNFTTGLRGRMTLMFGLILLLGCLVLGYISANRAASALESEASEAMLKVAKQAAETVDSRIQARIYTVEGIAARNIIRGKSGDREATLEEKLQLLRDEQKRAESLGFKRFGIVDKAGNAVYNDGSTANLADREHFKVALGGKTFVSSTIVGKVDNSIIYGYATPIRHYATNEIIGVLVGIVDGSKFNELVSSITYGRTGYALAVDSTGKFIAHKDVDKVLKQENIVELAKSDQSLASAAAIISKMAKGEEGVGSYTYQGQKKFMAYAPIKTTGWSIGVNVPKEEVLEKAATLQKIMLLVSILIILVALVLTFVIANTITNTLALAVNHLNNIADGDFTQPLPEKFLRRKDEIGILVGAIDKLQISLRPLLADLNKGMQTLAGSSENLSAASEEIASSSNEVAKAIQQVAVGAGEQAGNLQEILRLFETMAHSLDGIYTRLNNVKNNSDNTSRLAEVGKKEMDLLVGSIREVRESFEDVVNKVKELTKSVNQVGEIVDTINGIADQTNLLALNAAIEAARAGEAGRGFAVVAEEVRKLAEESRASSNKIRELLSNITTETERVVSTSDEVSRQMADQLGNVEKSIISFDNILESVTAMLPIIEEAYKQIDNTVRDKDAVLELVQSVSAISEENSASAEEISASAEELSATTEEIAASAQEVLNIAKGLEEQAKRFKV